MTITDAGDSLDTIPKTIERIRASIDMHVDADLVQDPSTTGDTTVGRAWEPVVEGRAPGVFQMETSGVGELVEELVRCDGLSEPLPVFTLRRPGPMSSDVVAVREGQ